MSKVFINPTQKGIDLFPDATRQPIKLLIPGTEHDPVLRAKMIAEYSGRLTSFQRLQTQLASLSPGTWYQQRVDIPGARMTYTNNLGQEVLRLDVHPRKLVRSGDYWDWALVEFSADLQSRTNTTFAAFFVSPVLTPLTPSMLSPIQVRGVARDQATWLYGGAEAGDHPILAYPDYASAAVLTRPDTGLEKSSLRIDLRPLRGLADAAVSVWGACNPMPATVKNYKVTRTVVASTNLTYGAGFAAARKAFYDPYANRGTPGNYDTWVYGLGGDIYGPYGFLIYNDQWSPLETNLGGPIPIGNPIPDGTPFREEVIRISYTQDEVPPNSVGIYASVVGQLFKGTPADTWSEVSGAYDYYREWEDSHMFPNRWPLQGLGSNILLPAISGVPTSEVFNHFGLHLLGSVLIDLVHGAISFKAA